MRAAAGLLALLTVCAVHAPAGAQERGGARVSASPVEVIAAPDAVPGAVVSTVLRVQRPAAASSAVFEAHAAERVLLYGARTGDVVVREDVGLIPLTFSLPRETATGVMRVARVEVEWTDGTTWSADIETRVVVRRGIELELDTASVFVARGTGSQVRFVVRNTGNAVDTLRLLVLKPESWAIEAPGPIVVPAGASLTDSLQLRVPASAAYGETQIVRITATGSGSQSSGNLAVTVAERDVAEGGMLRLPATITLGAVDAGMLERTPVSLALEMQGSLGSGTEASLLVRRSPHAATSPAFYRYLSGPALRAEVRRGQNHVAAGDVLFIGSALHGGSVLGTGVSGGAALGSLQASVFAARPHQFDAPARPGHLLGATAGVTTGVGAIGVSVSDMARPAGMAEQTEQSRVAALTFRGNLARGLTTRAEAGIMTLRDASGRAREGVALELESAWRSDRFDLQGHLRRVPGSLATSGSATDETYLGGVFRMGERLTLNGWLVRGEAELLSGTGARHQGSALSLRWQDGGASAQVSAYLRQTSGGGILTGETEQRSIAVGGSVPLGPLLAEGTVELGQASGGDSDRPLRQITSRLTYQAGTAWAWLALSHSEGVFGSDLTRLDAGSTLRMGRVELDGRVGTWFGHDAGSRLDAWLSTTLHVTSRTALIAGIDYAPWRFDSDDMRISLGARHRLGVPLPFRRRAQVQGVIYEDRNGNLQRDPGEHGVEGVRVRRGNTFVTTSADGRYAFYSERSSSVELSVDAGTLAPGLMMLPGVGLPVRGAVDVPLVRAAALRLHVFQDGDGDATRSAAEADAPRAVIELTDVNGRTRTATADQDGHVAFGALPPGEYSVRARIDAGRQGAGAPRAFTLHPGEATAIEIGVPRRAREIRFGVPPAVTADTLAVDTVTVIQPDGDTTAVRSNQAPPRAGGQQDVGTGARGAEAAVRHESVGVHTAGWTARVPVRAADSATGATRTGFGVAGWALALGLALGPLLLFVWKRRDRDEGDAGAVDDVEAFREEA